ncbi:leucine-rich repeat receptor-like kinase protein HAR1 [Cryptomeria japonica]|uniref:leucine-rich repeat receptor-like kinase protein HAR1 n=1 Tax=Cryptomeria japonica TaxID=3369 RepID=UPI0027D9E9F9|nr:leucine-rich repeat receptor-like kinase protein HAR1 [Cryptomeria japonica]
MLKIVAKLGTACSNNISYLHYWTEVDEFHIFRNLKESNMIGSRGARKVSKVILKNGLFDHLHSGQRPQMALQWPKRYQIALGVARVLCYMHHNFSPPKLHKDVKSSNILLDRDLGAKIADFGVSRELHKLGDKYTLSGYVGSHGNIAPEYAETRLKVNKKSNVYSFGVVVLELVSGKKATGDEKYGEDADIVSWIRNTIRMGREEMEVLDEHAVKRTIA